MGIVTDLYVKNVSFFIYISLPIYIFCIYLHISILTVMVRFAMYLFVVMFRRAGHSLTLNIFRVVVMFRHFVNNGDFSIRRDVSMSRFVVMFR